MRQARFLISEDPELSPIGAATSINYEEDFHKYRRLLHGYRASPSPVYWRKLTHLYQKITFADVPNSSTAESDTDTNNHNANVNDDEDFSRALQLAQTHYGDNDDDDKGDNVSNSHTAHTSSLRSVSNFDAGAASIAPPARRPSSPPLSYISDMGIERLRIGEIDDSEDLEFEAQNTPSTPTEDARARGGRIIGQTATEIEPARTTLPQYGFAPNDRLTTGIAPARGRGRSANRHITTEPTPAASIESQQGLNNDAAQLANEAPRRGHGHGRRTNHTEFEPPLEASSEAQGQGRDEHGLDALVDGIPTKGRVRVARGRGRGRGLSAVETPPAEQPRRASQRKTGKS